MRKGKLIGKIFVITLICSIIGTILLSSIIPQNQALASDTFQVGDQVEVINTSQVGLAVRQPAAGEIVNRVFNGTKGKIIEGPKEEPLSGTTYTWWKIEWENELIAGWSAEGEPDGIYYLKKVSEGPPARVFGIDVSHHRGEIKWLKVYKAGYRFAFVKASEGSEEGRHNILAELPSGTEVEILEHSDNGVLSDGYYWWYIEVTSEGKFKGKRGWIAHIGFPPEVELTVGKKVNIAKTIRLRSSLAAAYIDENFEENMNNAHVLVGAYHYACPDLRPKSVGEEIVSDAIAEAELFLSEAGKYIKPGYLRPVLDVEDIERRKGEIIYIGKELGKKELSKWIHDWMETVKTKTGVEPILYTHSNYAKNYLDNGSLTKYDLTVYNLWIAHWTYDLTKSPKIGIWKEKGWDFWQYCDRGRIQGVEKPPVDLDIFNGDISKLRDEFLIKPEVPEEIVPIDLVLVLDRSGSMSEYMGDKTKIEGAKESAITVINALLPGDRVAVVSFSSYATVNVELTSDFDYAKSEVEKITPGGVTSFGAGLKAALDELEARGNPEQPRAVIFMSNGWHNTNPPPESYVAEYYNLGIPIYTVGLGAEPGYVNEELLKWMASETGGQYLFAKSLYYLQNSFLRFSLEVKGFTPIDEFAGWVSEGETVTAGTFEIAPGTPLIRVTLNWPGSDLDLVLTRPDGTLVDLEGDPDVEDYSGAAVKPEWVILGDPQPGVWTVQVFGKVITSPDEQYIVWVSGYTPPAPPTVQADIDLDPDTLNLNEGGKWVTVYIDLPEGYDVHDIDIGTVMLNDTVSAENDPKYGFVKDVEGRIGDYDDDGLLDCMVKFDSSEVQVILEVGDEVEVTISGEVGGIAFEGSDIIRVMNE